MIRWSKMGFLCGLSWLLPVDGLARSPDETAIFVEANLITIFYHELGHAVIDLQGVPIFGQEEDAADVMAVLMIDRVFEEQSAQTIALESAFGFISNPDGFQEPAYWSTHGPDEQRYYNHVCIFYGASPDTRRGLARELGLPEQRAETCPDEFDQAAAAWGMIFDEMEVGDQRGILIFEPGVGAAAQLANAVIGAEVDSLNEEISLAEDVVVRVESCGEANAFYDPADISIQICTELVEHFEGLLTALGTGAVTR